MKTRKLKMILTTAMCLLLWNCGEKEITAESAKCSDTEIETAFAEGRNTARDFVRQDWVDTMELQRALLDAKVEQSKYLIAGKKQCAEAFDSAFISTIKIIKPQLAEKIFK